MPRRPSSGANQRSTSVSRSARHGFHRAMQRVWGDPLTAKLERRSVWLWARALLTRRRRHLAGRTNGPFRGLEHRSSIEIREAKRTIGIDSKADTGSIPQQIQRMDPEPFANALDTLHGEVSLAALDRAHQRSVPPDCLAEGLLREALQQPHAPNIGTNDSLQDPFHCGRLSQDATNQSTDRSVACIGTAGTTFPPCPTVSRDGSGQG